MKTHPQTEPATPPCAVERLRVPGMETASAPIAPDDADADAVQRQLPSDFTASARRLR